MTTIEAAKGKWRYILFDFGLTPAILNGKHQPCPMCGGKDRFRWDNDSGSGGYFCSGCGPGFGIDLAMGFSGLSFKDVVCRIDRMLGDIPANVPANVTVDVEKMKANYKRIITESSRINHFGYLKFRNINTHPNVYFHEMLPFYEDGKEIRKQPAMIGILQNPKGEGIALHRTYINEDFSTIRKLTKGIEPLVGSAIRLYKADKVVGVAEGIETACSAHQRFNMPVWSVVSSSLMEAFEPPEGIEVVSIFGDNDENYAGQKSAYVLANKLSKRGYEVYLNIPNKIGDWNDEGI